MTEVSVRDNGKEENQVLLHNTPRASLADRASLDNVYRRLRDDLRRVSCLLFLQQKSNRFRQELIRLAK